MTMNNRWRRFSLAALASGVLALQGQNLITQPIDSAVRVTLPGNIRPEATEANWQKTLEQFRASNQAFREALQKLSPDRLDELSAAGKRSFYNEAHGLIEHHVYHAGQISLLAKAMNQS